MLQYVGVSVNYSISLQTLQTRSNRHIHHGIAERSVLAMSVHMGVFWCGCLKIYDIIISFIYKMP